MTDWLEGLFESIACLFTKKGRALLREKGWMNSKYRARWG